MCTGTAVDAEIVDAQIIGRGTELGDLEVVASERVERDRNHMAAGQAAAAMIGE